jgi:hypothetical protein
MTISRIEPVLSGEPAAQVAALTHLVESWRCCRALVQYNRDSHLGLDDVAWALQGAKALRVQDYVCQEPDWVEQVARRLWVTSWSIGPAELPVRRLFYTLVVGPGTELGLAELTYLTETLQAQCGQPMNLEVLFALGEAPPLEPRVRVLLVAALS